LGLPGEHPVLAEETQAMPLGAASGLKSADDDGMLSGKNDRATQKEKSMKCIRVLFLSVVILAGFLFGSCTKAAARGETPRAPGAPSRNDCPECDLIPLATIASTLSFPGLGAPESVWYSPMRTCLYPLGGNKNKVTISYLSGVTRESFLDERARGEKGLSRKAVEVPGLGEGAYIFTMGRITSLSVLKGSVRVMITSSAPLEKEKQLALIILARL
jgi:hypothetical protein